MHFGNPGSEGPWDRHPNYAALFARILSILLRCGWLPKKVSALDRHPCFPIGPLRHQVAAPIL
jgi:hypothetical protein